MLHHVHYSEKWLKNEKKKPILKSQPNRSQCVSHIKPPRFQAYEKFQTAGHQQSFNPNKLVWLSNRIASTTTGIAQKPNTQTHTHASTVGVSRAAMFSFFSFPAILCILNQGIHPENLNTRIRLGVIEHSVVGIYCYVALCAIRKLLPHILKGPRLWSRPIHLNRQIKKDKERDRQTTQRWRKIWSWNMIYCCIEILFCPVD